MKAIVDLMFEAQMLKHVQRSGYAFLGAGKESVAEHSFVCAFIAWIMSRLAPDADPARVMGMCLVHDLPESRIGDLNLVQKHYVKADEESALSDAVSEIPFGDEIAEWIHEFNAGQTLEAQLSRDADQLSLLLDLKRLSDCGYAPPDKWIPNVVRRLRTDVGKRIAETILAADKDDWWMKILIDT